MKSRVTTGDPRGVFYDLFDDEAEAANLTIRGDLMIELKKAIEKSGMKQVQIAKVLGLAQSRVSYIKNSRIDKFTIDKLVNMLATLGMVVSTKVKKAKAA